MIWKLALSYVWPIMGATLRNRQYSSQWLSQFIEKITKVSTYVNLETQLCLLPKKGAYKEKNSLEFCKHVLGVIVQVSLEQCQLFFRSLTVKLKICGFLNAHVYQSSSTLVTYVNPISLANKLSPNCLFKFSCNAFAVPTCHIAENLASITLIRGIFGFAFEKF